MALISSGRLQPVGVRPRRFVRPLAGSLASLLVVAACATGGSGSSPVASPSDDASLPAESSEAAPSQSASGAVTLPAPEKTDIRLGINGFSVAGLNTILPSELDLFEKYGLNVEMFEFDGDTQTVQALRAGQIDAAYMSGQPPVASQLTPEPLTTVFVTNSKLTDYFVTAPDIKTPQDLVGKQIAVSGLGASSHGQVLLALKELGVDPNDVTITPIGGGSERAAAMLAGSVQAATLGTDEISALKDAGFNEMLDLSTIEGAGIARSALSVPASWIEQYPNTVLALVAASVDGITTMFTDIPAGAKVVAKRMGVTEAEATELIQAEMSRGWSPRDGRPEAEWFELGKELLTIVDPQFADVDASKAFTAQFIDQLEANGFFAEHGVPAKNPMRPDDE